jgi:hypothetical protein
MYPRASWHAEGLRWIASLILGAADYLERVSGDPQPPYEPLPPDLLPADDALDDIRARIQSRYF